MTETRLTHPIDIELEERIIAFREEIARLNNSDSDNNWFDLVELAKQSPWWWLFEQTKDFTFWDRVGAPSNVLFNARQSKLVDGIYLIGPSESAEMIKRTSDPDYFLGLQSFCAHILRGSEIPRSDGETFQLDDVLLKWAGGFLSGHTKKPRNKKKQLSRNEPRNEAVSRTVFEFKALGLPVFKNPTSGTPINCCEIVAEAISQIANDDYFSPENVKKIFYKSQWRNLD